MTIRIQLLNDNSVLKDQISIDVGDQMSSGGYALLHVAARAVEMHLKKRIATQEEPYFMPPLQKESHTSKEERT